MTRNAEIRRFTKPSGLSVYQNELGIPRPWDYLIKNRKLFEAWDRADPVVAWEIERCKRIEKVQGNKNLFC
jgi:endonuclease I